MNLTHDEATTVIQSSATILATYQNAPPTLPLYAVSAMLQINGTKHIFGDDLYILCYVDVYPSRHVGASDLNR